MSNSSRSVFRRSVTGALAVALVAGPAVVGSTVTANADAASLQKATATVTAKVTITARRSAAATMSATVTATVPGSSVAPISVSMTASVTRTVTSAASSAGRKTITARAVTKAKAKARAKALAGKAARAAARAKASPRAAAAASAKAVAAANAAARGEAIRLANAKAVSQAQAVAPGSVPSIGVVSVTPTSGPCGGAAAPIVNGRATVCSFNDEFNDTTVDSTKWSAVTTASSGFRNNKAECFIDSPDTISESGGTLKLTTRPSPGYACKDGRTDFISGSVSSIGKFSQAYGTFSIRAKFPKSTVAGLHSALWMWPNNPAKYVSWPMSGEIDIAERFSKYNDRSIPYLHYVYNAATTSAKSLIGNFKTGYSATGTNVATNNYCVQPDPDAFHTYTMTWEPGRIAIAFDGKTCIDNSYRASALPSGAPFDQPFFMILTQALGVAGTANAPTAATPKIATTEVDWVRVWK